MCLLPNIEYVVGELPQYLVVHFLHTKCQKLYTNLIFAIFYIRKHQAPTASEDMLAEF